MTSATQETTFAVTTVDYSPDSDRQFKTQCERQMHFKAAASYAAAVITSEDNYSFVGVGRIDWRVRPTIRGAAGVEQITMTHDGALRTYDDYLWGVYPQAMYVVTAMQNAIAEVKARGAEMLTLTEVEETLGLKAGVVRKHIFDHAELAAGGAVRKADGRTWLMRRDYALARWGKGGAAISRDTIEYDKVVSGVDRLTSDAWERLEALEYTPKTVTATAEYAETEIRPVGDGFACIERITYKDGVHQYRVASWSKNAALRNNDLTVWQRDGQIVHNYQSEREFGAHLKALGVFGVAGN